jgi:hypothetical protein
MSRPCLDRDNPVYPYTFANIRVEIECAGRYSYWSFCCPGYLHSFLRSHYKYLTEAMVKLADDRGQMTEDRISISDFGLRIWDLRCGMWDAGGGMWFTVHPLPFTD